MKQIHILTPGDHFSPRTGSAIPTVVNGLCQWTEPRPAVVVARGTFTPWYQSADVLEYDLTDAPWGASRSVRSADVARGRIGLPRPWARRVGKQTLVNQITWDPAYVISHNAPQIVPLVTDRHAPVLYVHNNLFEHYSRRELGQVLAGVHRIICVSQYIADRLISRAPRAVSQAVRVVPNGVDVAAFSRPRSENSSTLRVCFVGRVVQQKGVHVLLEAVARLQRSDVQVTIIGSNGFSADVLLTPYENELRRIAARCRGKVTFMPFQPRGEVVKLLSEMDVVVVPSVWPEPFGLTILEGMASGAAVVATRVGGAPEVVGDAGLLVGPNDAEQLARALAALADSTALVESLSKRGVRRAKLHDWSVSAAKLQAALT